MSKGRDIVIEVVKRGLWPALKQEGFKKKGLSFARRRGEMGHFVNVQLSQFNSGSSAMYFINVGIMFDRMPLNKATLLPELPTLFDCQYRERLENIYAPAKLLREVDEKSDIDAVAKQLAEGVMRGFVEPCNKVIVLSDFEKTGWSPTAWNFLPKYYYHTGQYEKAKARLKNEAKRFAHRGQTFESLAESYELPGLIDPTLRVPYEPPARFVPAKTIGVPKGATYKSCIGFKGKNLGQAPSPRSLKKLIPQLRNFVREQIITDGPKEACLLVFKPTEFDPYTYFDEHMELAKSCFGANPKRGNLSISTFDGSTVKKVADEINNVWDLPAEDFEKALDFMLEGHPWPKQLFGPVLLSFSLEFLWKDSRTGLAFPEQESGFAMEDGRAISKLEFQLQANPVVESDLIFPYESGDPRLYELLAQVTQSLPLKMSLRRFYQLVPAKQRVAYTQKKLSSEAQSRLSEFSS